jgi:hypothetical protein
LDERGQEKKVKLMRTGYGLNYVYNYFYPNVDARSKGISMDFFRGRAWKKLTDSIGYTDLKYLVNKDVGKMFKALGNCSTIIFDLRCYPNNTMDKIMLHLFDDNPEYITFGKLDPYRFNTEYYVKKKVLPSGLLARFVPAYKGKIIVLTNEVAQSQAETMLLAFKALGSRCTVIGSNTAGTNGNMSYLNLPYGVTVSYSAVGVYDTQMRCFQGTGISPDIFIQNTISDIMQSRDAVLQKAIEYSTK